MLMTFLLVGALFLLTGCTPAPTATPPPAEIATPAASAADTLPQSDATARADALIADMHRNEEALAKLEREAPKIAAPRLDNAAPQSVPPSATPAQTTAASAAPPSASDAVTFGGHDEAWWKNEMRTADVRATDDARRLQEAMDARAMASNQMSAAVKAGAVVFAQAQEAFNRANAEVQRLQAEVRNDAAAVDRVREDARRANVPPGWLRWP